jgi:uncharacterized protein (DUF885 family)
MRLLPVLLAALLASPAAQAQSASQRLGALLDAEQEAGMQGWPPWGSARGQRRFDALMPDVSPRARARAAAASRARLVSLERIPLGDLTRTQQTTAALYRRSLRMRHAEERFHTALTPVGPLGGPQQWVLQMATRTPYTTPTQLAALAQRYAKIPRYLQQEIQNLRQGLKEGRTPPRVVLKRVVKQALMHTSEATRADPSSHPLFKPYLQASPALQRQVRALISDSVIPAFRRFATFLREVYLPGCRTTLGASDLPQGAAYYAHVLRHHSTLDLSAEQIHATGRREVARIQAEMHAVIERSGFRALGNKAQRFSAFLRYLRTDPRFYHRSAEELVDGYRVIAKRVDAHLPKLFRVLPRLPYGVRAMESAIAPSSPTAYYYHGSAANGVAGTFVANTHKLDSRPRYEMVPLTLHEAVPGHHLQIGLAQELTNVHAWRRDKSYTAFVEGWALYAERLGLEMGPDGGLYKDPYDDFGRLTYEMWRAMRLVVDTGLHSKSWTRAQAIDYMLSHSALTQENVEREVDRYISWPGQAVAYKLGELKIRALRAEAQKALGKTFDIRAFHDVVLGQGAVPLGLLEEQVRRWIRARKAGPY